MDYQKAIEFTRYNSGKHFLDSGGESGRLWQQENPSQDLIEYTVGSNDVTDVAINTTALLAQKFELDENHQNYLDVISRMGNDWFEDTAKYLEDLDFQLLASDNTYNTENDISQGFAWEIYCRPERYPEVDWIYAEKEDVLIVIYVHTGADIRGGYSPPLFVNYTGEGEFAFPLSFKISWFLEATSSDEEFLDYCKELNNLSLFEDGYSSCPTTHLTTFCGNHGIWTDDGYQFDLGKCKETAERFFDDGVVDDSILVAVPTVSL